MFARFSKFTKSYSTRRPLEVSQYKRRSIDKNAPQRPLKAWERAGEDKDTFFKKRYAHIHAKQKQTRVVDKHDMEMKQLKREEQQGERAMYKSKYRENKSRILETIRKAKNPFSEFVYGTNSVVAALKSNKRPSHFRLLLQGVNAKDAQLVALAKSKGVYIENSDKQTLNELSNNNPHNGVVLETRPAVVPSVVSLGAVDPLAETYNVEQYGASTGILSKARGHAVDASGNRLFPLGVYLDEVTDPHNVGALIRSAYFLGADFVAISRKNSAPLGPVTSKASSGASELMDVFYVDSPLSFIPQCQSHGWNFIAATTRYPKKTSYARDQLQQCLAMSPCVLVLGSEGFGIRKSVVDRCDAIVSVPNSSKSSLVDSLNVSVAGGILMSDFLRA